MIPVWFGRDDERCFGWWHVPESGNARGAAILCPPLGMEQLVAHRTMRTLAQEVATRGIAAFRFDYPGTGDSSGDLHGPHLVQAWRTSIRLAVDQARVAGMDHVALVGLRMGANLAWSALAHGLEATQVVLWDPCPSGAGFLREKRALQLLEFPETAESNTDSAGVDTPGFYYPADILADLRGVTVDPASIDHVSDRLHVEGGSADFNRILLLTRPDKAVGTKIRALGVSTSVDLLETTNQDRLFDVPDILACVPQQTVREVVTWLSERMPVSSVRCAVRGIDSAVVGSGVDDVRVREQATLIGDRGLFAMVTEGADTRGPTVFLTNTAVTYHVGPGRMWVELARLLATRGFRVVRFDVGDVGDGASGTTPDGPFYYSKDSLADSAEVVRAFTREPKDSVIVGLCSGSWVALRLTGDLGVGRAILLNPLTLRRRMRRMGPHGRTIPSIRIAVHKRASRWRPVRWLAVSGWRALATLHVVSSTTAALCSRRTGESDITVLVGREELASYTMALPFFGRRRVRKSANVHVTFIDNGDHALLTRDVRDQYFDAVLSEFVAPGDEHIGLSTQGTRTFG